MKPLFQIILAAALGAVSSAWIFPAGQARADVRFRAHREYFDIGVASPGCFRLSISERGPAVARKSIFLAPVKKSALIAVKATCGPVRKADMTGLGAPFGQLLVNEKTGQAELLGHRGNVLVSGIRLSRAGGLHLTLGMKTGEHFYAGGSNQRQLTLDPNNVKTYVGNGDAFIPFYWSTAGYAVFVVSSKDNQPPNRSVDRSKNVVRFTNLPGRSVDVYLMPAKTISRALASYTALTGRPPVPPEWAFGYLQSKWGWHNAAFVKDTLARFRRDKLPVDAFIFDVEWYTTLSAYGMASKTPGHDFQFNPILFPHPHRQVRYFQSQRLRWMAIRKPRLENPRNLAMARARGWLLCQVRPPVVPAPGNRVLNFALPAVRRWWFHHNAKFITRYGLAGWWNDEGEATYTLYYYWNLAEYDGLKRIRPDMRQFSISRAFCPGMVRLGASVWTGDTPTNWETLRQQPAHLLNYSLAGMPWGTCDIGGFCLTPSPALMTRFLQAGVFFPIMRSHSCINSPGRFPWLYGKAAENAIRQALDLRYRLIPFLYSLAHETYHTGMPIMRPLLMEFPDDPRVADLTSQWLMGRGLMVAPMLTNKPTRVVYFPAGTWYKFETAKTIQGPSQESVSPALAQIPIYVRAGTILTLGPVIQSTQLLPGGPLTVEVYPGANAHFSLVEDDGTTYNYQRGIQRTTVFTWNNLTHTLRWLRRGKYNGANVFRKMRVVVYYPAGRVSSAVQNLTARGGMTLSPP